jgi:hypothetical protein
VRKIAVKRLIRDEKGQTLILVLILLAVGALIIAPLLDYMGTGLISGEVYDKKTDELYAADAGAEDAVWKIQNQVDEVYYLYCGGGNHTLSYNITDVNGKSVAVTIAYVDAFTYNVTSIATGDGSGTKIVAYITAKSRYGDFSGMLNHVLTSEGTFYCPNPPTPCPCSKLNDLVSPGCNETNGPNPYYDPLNWPTPQDLAGFYWWDVNNVTPYPSDTIDLNGSNMTLGPLYRNVGPTFTINNGKSQTNPTLKLTGTLYITCDTLIGTTGNDFTLDLNGNTIFVSSNTTGNQKALSIGDRVTIQGPGVIIAVGDMYFAPKSQLGGTTNPIFMLSVLGQSLLQPGGDFYGAIAGGVEVDLKSGNKVYYPSGGFGSSDLNFPTGIQYLIYSIASWEVIPL